MEIFRDVVLARRGDPNPAILFEDQSYSYAQYVDASLVRSAFLLDQRREGPLHVGVLLDNVPEFPMWLGAAALAGATVVGINPTRRGAELERDIRHTDCQLIVTEARHAPMLEGLDLDLPPDRILDIESDDYLRALEPHAGADVPDVTVEPRDRLLLLFTSGTSGAPKAVICSQLKLALVGQSIVGIAGLSADTVAYQVMPMFHSNALFAGWSPTVVAGGASALRRKFSASGFLPDVRRFGATYFNYVGKPLSYILATPEREDDADNPLRYVFGNEGADLDIGRFSQRFGVPVQDGYGSTETGASVSRSDDMPKGSLGRAPEGLVILDSETEKECPVADFDANGRIVNPEEAIGEMVNTQGPALFEGYYNNDEANEKRMRNGWFWTGDLAYRDSEGFIYFAGRDFEWLRVDGENFAAAPIERILSRFPGVVLAAVYAVPDAEVGDQVMAALELVDPEAFDPDAFERFLHEQSDLGTKWAPHYVRVTHHLPITQTSKVQKRKLRAERWECDELVFFRPNPEAALRPITADDAVALRREFEARDRENLLI
ncbi:AMP-binding protein [Myxococcota bacterium]|nr:AMP-binding protein [Myxococcota bacterium]